MGYIAAYAPNAKIVQVDLSKVTHVAVAAVKVDDYGNVTPANYAVSYC